MGTELLLGDIVDTNAAFLSRELAGLGIFVYRRVCVGDNEGRLAAAFGDALANADLIIATGGLGPTADDITKEAAASAMGLTLTMDMAILGDIKAAFARMKVPMPVSNEKQALIPEGARPLANPNGTAPGIYITKNDKIIALLPGPPAEMEPMFKNELLPLLLPLQRNVLVSKTLRMSGIGESAMEAIVQDMLNMTNPTIAPYAGNFEVRLRITAKSADRAGALDLIEPVRAELYERLGGYIYGEDDERLEAVVLAMLASKNLRLALAESCTGGLLASRLTAVPGASAVFVESSVTYSNDAKERRLGVSADTLRAHGAVSSQTALEMAAGAALRSGADIGLGITGVAGPGGGTAEKPVGLVFIAIWNRGAARFITMESPGSRERVRNRAVAQALGLLWRELK